MSLLVYTQTSPGVYTAYSVGGTHTDPITTVHDGRNGDTEELNLYVGRESGNTSTFTNVRLEAQTLTADDDIGSGSNPGDTGWGVKLMIDPGHDPTESEWATTDYGTTIEFADISTDAKLPFWYRIESPHGEDVQNKKNVTLTLMFTETP